jgi:hypothetical protein
MEPGESLIVTPGAVLGLFYLQRYRFLTITQVARVTGLSYHHTADLLRGFAARGHGMVRVYPDHEFPSSGTEEVNIDLVNPVVSSTY